MAKQTSQAGFSIVHFLLVLVILGIVGFTGWYVYKTQKDTDKTLQDTSKSTLAETPPAAAKTEKDDKLPEGLVWYEADDLGIRFAYPQAWGEVKREEGPETEHLVAGSEYVFSFDKNKAVTAATRSKDWKHDDKLGHDGMSSAAVYSNADKSLFSGGTVTNINDFTFISQMPFAGIGCDGVGSLLVSKLDNPTYPDIVFMYVDKNGSGEFDDAMCQGDNYKQYLNKDHFEELKQMANYIVAVY